MSQIIKPKVLKGFRDSLPDSEIPKKKLIKRLESVFELFGYVPIDTPALEYTEVLLGKGGGETDKQVYRFEDNGKRDVSMRFDLTVPFARFMALNSSKVGLPFRRYHINKVWRGENTQRGRYREFYQCDFDIVGTKSILADLDTLLLMSKAMETLEVGDYTININHRGLFNEFLENLEIKNHSEEILRAVDKLPKIGEEKVRELLNANLSDEKIDLLLQFISTEDSFEKTLEKLETMIGGPSPSSQELRDIQQHLTQLGQISHFKLNPSITRGLDYYTGLVFETFLDGLPQIGSVCSGGRYDQLASLYTKEDLPGVGASVGLDRLLAALEELGRSLDQSPGVQAMILNFNPSHTSKYLSLLTELRNMGVGAELFPTKKKPNPQYNYAEKKGIPWVLSLNDEDVKQNTFSAKNIRTGELEKTLDPNAFMKLLSSSKRVK